MRRLVLALAIFLGLHLVSHSAPMLPETIPLSSDQITQLKQQAESGDKSAQYEMSRLYLDWIGIAPDYIEAARWLRVLNTPEAKRELKALDKFIADHQTLSAAAQSGNPTDLYIFAHHTPHNATGLAGDASTLHWLLRAAEAGHTEAQYEIGKLYWKAYYQRRTLLEAGISDVSPDTEHELSQLKYGTRTFDSEPLGFEGESLATDIDWALHFLTLAAQKGNRDAAYELGFIYAMEGRHHDIDLTQRWLAKAIGGKDYNIKDICHFYFTGELYQYPLDANHKISLIAYEGSPDYAAAMKCYQSLRHPTSQSHWAMGYMYLHGLGTNKDEAMAEVTLLEAVKHGGSVEAAWELSRLYRDNPVSGNLPKAYTLLSTAIDDTERAVIIGCIPALNRTRIQNSRYKNLSAMKADQADLYHRLTAAEQTQVTTELGKKNIWPNGRPADLPPDIYYPKCIP